MPHNLIGIRGIHSLYPIRCFVVMNDEVLGYQNFADIHSVQHALETFNIVHSYFYLQFTFLYR